MSPRFVLGRENVSCVAEVLNRSLKADCTDFTYLVTKKFPCSLGTVKLELVMMSDIEIIVMMTMCN